MFDDVPDAKAAEPSALSRAGAAASDVVQSAGAGIIRGAAGLVDLPQTLAGLADAGAGILARGAIRMAGGTPASDQGVDVSSRSVIPPVANLPRAGDAAVHGLEEATGKLYEPQTTAGEYARTAAEFIPGAGRSIAGIVKNALIPAVASETAGQATKGTAAEPWARGAAGLAAGVGAAAAGRRSAAERMFDRSFGTVTPEEYGQIQKLVDDAAGLRAPDGTLTPIDLSWPEAAQQILGPRRAGDLMRIVEGQGGLSEFFARRPEQIRAAGHAGLDTIAPAGAAPTQVGEAARSAAQSGMAATPEGQAVIRATQAVGPRVTPAQAGAVIQREMRGVADAREAKRAEQAARDYPAARDAPERAGVERTVTVERPGEPLLQTIDPGPAPPPRFDAPIDGGPATIGSLAPQRQPAPPRDPGARSLSRYIAENGGIGLERGDVKAAGLDRWKQPGVGSLVRTEGGKSIDSFWREKLIEDGYLPPDVDGGAARNIHDELLGLLQQEQRGQKVYPYDWSGSDERSGFSRLRDQHQDAAGRAMSDIRASLTESGVDPKTMHKDVLDRAAAALMRGDALDPLDAVEAAVRAAREPAARPTSRMVPTTVTEEVSAPRFGQVDPQPAIDALDWQIRTAKGDVRSALEGIRRDLYEYGTDPVSGIRETDMTVEGLLHARERIDQHIAAAQEAGDRTKIRDLEIVRSSLDDQLKGVPEVAKADAGFAANSRPLEPFAGNTPLGRVTARDDLTKRMQTPAEQVPGMVQGATAARELLANATPEARRAFSGREVTRILDEARGGEGGLSAVSIRSGMQRNEDVLAQLPEAQQSLARLARAYEGRALVEKSPLGRIARAPHVEAAIDALFPTKTTSGAAQEVTEAVRRMATSNPAAARDLVRMHLETEFGAAKQQRATGPDQKRGAYYAARLRGNEFQQQNIEAALKALPNGEAINVGFSRLLDILEATGQRQGVGSKTAFNTEALQDLRQGGAAVEAGKMAATGGLKLPTRIKDALDRWQLGENTDELARLMTSPEGGRRLAQLASAKPGAATIALLNRLTALAARGAQTGDRPARPEGEPLELRVRAAQ
ncbi:hypothetical protein [Methylobacterium aquaticum]|uniref:hypothetical protein n=1 Tax=Methylobacterium aquaticum TaxID=270351 RepID=UPI0011AE7325|nr:hypothetical protein [Methylobacterium aquaticum]